MNLIEFVKDAAHHLGFGPAGPTSDELVAAVKNAGLNADGLTISVDGDKVSVSGTAASQEESEKIALALGNNKGIASVANSIEVPVAAPPSVFYTVVRGDTLSAISKAHYHDANKYNVIFEANRPMLSSPDKIYPGQVLRIPPLG